MNQFIFNDILFSINLPDLIKRIHMNEDSEDFNVIATIVEQAGNISKPKALYKESFISETGYDYVVLDGIKFNSRLLKVNFEGIYRVFPYVVTCGKEIDNWAKGFSDPLEEYWVDSIKEMILRSAISFLNNHIKDKYQLPTLSAMNPGSLAYWPIDQQKTLFSLLGDVESLIGVHLSDSFLMIPTKSVSGIYFPTEIHYENCQLCSREKCPGRRAPFDEHFYKDKL